MEKLNHKKNPRNKLTAVTISKGKKKHTVFINLPYTKDDKAIAPKQLIDDLATKHLNCRDGDTYTCG